MHKENVMKLRSNASFEKPNVCQEEEDCSTGSQLNLLKH